MLAAVSGGSDSVALLHVLARVLPSAGHRLEVAHVHHGVRGAEADGDAEFVQELATKLGLTCHVLRVANLDATDEATLREARLGLLKALALGLGMDAIAFGQQRDDAAETFLLMALRGSGAAGLGSLRTERTVDGLRMLRPMLECSRDGLRQWLREQEAAWREDASNESLRYRRNRLRQKVMPLLSGIEPGAIGNLARSAELCASAGAALQMAATMLVGAAISQSCVDARMFDMHRLRSAPPEITSEMIRREWHELSAIGEEDRPELFPSFQQVQAIMDRIANPDGDEFAANDGRVGILCNNHHLLLHLLKRSRTEVLQELVGSWTLPLAGSKDWEEVLPMELLADGVIKRLPNGFAVEARLHGAVQDSFSHWLPVLIRGGNRAALVAMDGAEGSLRLATVAPSTTLTLKRGGNRRLSRLLRDVGVFSEVRPLVIGLYLAKELLWIPGIWRSPTRWATKETTRTLLLQWTLQSTLT